MVPIKMLLNSSKSPVVSTLSKVMVQQPLFDHREFFQPISKIMNADNEFSPPRCPVCGGEMTKRCRRTDQKTFWGCLSFTSGCRGSVDYEKWLEKERSRACNALVFASQVIGIETANEQALHENPEYAKAFNRVSAVAYRVLNLKNARLPVKQRILPWMSTPKVGLHGDIPADLIETIGGCERVEKLLIEIYEKESGQPFNDGKH